MIIKQDIWKWLLITDNHIPDIYHPIIGAHFKNLVEMATFLEKMIGQLNEAQRQFNREYMLIG